MRHADFYVTAATVIVFPLYAEWVTIEALYSNDDARSSRVIALVAISWLLLALFGMMVAFLQGENVFRGPGS